MPIFINEFIFYPRICAPLQDLNSVQVKCIIDYNCYCPRSPPCVVAARSSSLPTFLATFPLTSPQLNLTLNTCTTLPTHCSDSGKQPFFNAMNCSTFKKPFFPWLWKWSISFNYAFYYELLTLKRIVFMLWSFLPATDITLCFYIAQV